MPSNNFNDYGAFKPHRGKRSSAINNEILLENGEIYFEVPETGVGTAPGKIVMGDGVTPYEDLPYFTEQANADWDATTGVSVILNKPDVVSTFTGTRDEWDQLTVEEKLQYEVVNITDDIGTDIDLSNYVEKSDTVGLIKNDGSIDQNTYATVSEIPDISGKADKTGSYNTLGSGNLLIGNDIVGTNNTPYRYRKALSIENTSGYIDEKLVGTTINWNQLVENGNFDSITGWSCSPSTGATISVANNKATVSMNNASSYLEFKSTVVPAEQYKKYLFHAQITSSNRLAIVPTGTGSEGAVQCTGDGKESFGIWSNSVGKNFTFNIRIYSNSYPADISAIVEKCYLVDLTSMVGATVADYLYNLEITTAGAGIAKLKEWGFFNESYYDYNPGELVSVKPINKKFIGFNIWNENWRIASLNLNDGSWSSIGSYNQIASANMIPVTPNTTYYYRNGTSTIGYIAKYDKYGNYLGYNQLGGSINTFTTDNNCYNIMFQVGNYGTIYKNDICINVSDTNKNGTYEPYKENTISLNNTELRGLPKLDTNNNLYYDGDIYSSDGTITRKYSIIDLGDLTYQTSNSIMMSTTTPEGIYYHPTSSDIKTDWIICSKYTPDTPGRVYNKAADKIIAIRQETGLVYIYDSSYTDTTTFKNAMKGVYLVYQRTTNSSYKESSIPFNNPQYVYPYGTEEFIDDRNTKVPVGHETNYFGNVTSTDKLEIPPTESLDSNKDYSLNANNGAVNWSDSIKDSIYENNTIIDNNKACYLSRRVNKVSNASFAGDKYIGGTIAWNQLVENGDFSNGTNGWSTYQATISASNKVCTMVRAVASGTNSLYRNIIKVPNHKYYFSITLKNNVGTNTIAFSWTKSGTTGNTIVLVDNLTLTNTFTTYSGIIDTDNNDAEGALILFLQTTTVNNSIDVKNIQIVDLTLAFGSTIANYLYSLESASAGSGVALLKEKGFLSKSYYPYNTGELVSVKPTKKVYSGKNLLDLIPKTAGYQGVNYIISSNNHITAYGTSTGNADIATLSNNILPVKIGDKITISLSGVATGTILYFHKATANEYITIGGISSTSPRTYTFTSDELIDGILLRTTSGNTCTIDADFMIEYGDTATDYKPYRTTEYSLGNELRGIPKLINNEIVYDGDIYESNGNITRKYGIVDLGSVTYQYNSTYGLFSYAIPNGKIWAINSIPSIAINTNKYNLVGSRALAGFSDMTYTIVAATASIAFADSNYNNADTFKASMSGIYLVYELATPTTETSNTFLSSYSIEDSDGIEYFVDNRAIPVPVYVDTDYYTHSESKFKVPAVPNDNETYKLLRTPLGYALEKDNAIGSKVYYSGANQSFTVYHSGNLRYVVAWNCPVGKMLITLDDIDKPIAIIDSPCFIVNSRMARFRINTDGSIGGFFIYSYGGTASSYSTSDTDIVFASFVYITNT